MQVSVVCHGPRHARAEECGDNEVLGYWGGVLRDSVRGRRMAGWPRGYGKFWHFLYVRYHLFLHSYMCGSD